MVITKLNKEEYAGKKFVLKYFTKGYFDIEKTTRGFLFTYRTFDKVEERFFEDSFFSEWLENPIAYGAFENGNLLGYAEGTLEAWNQRFRISNICVFDEKQRHCGIGTELMKVILDEAKKSGARMVVLEAQSCNENAIGFYKKHGFDMIGFDLYAYSNHDPEKHEVRIEMGKMI